MGVKVHGMGSYGGVKDGYTFVYLHPIPYELYEDAQVYLEGPNGFALARAFSDNPPNWQTSKTNLDSVLQAPFVVLDAWLTNESNLINLIKYLPKYKEQLLKDPKFRYKLRMTENKYLIGIV